jgi:hypothetical protein
MDRIAIHWGPGSEGVRNRTVGTVEVEPMEETSLEPEKLRDVRRAIAAGQVAKGVDDAHASYWLDRYATLVARLLDGARREAPAGPRGKRSRQQ